MQIVVAGDTETFRIIGAAMEVHRRLGCGFLEAVYREALAIEFRERHIPFRTEHSWPIDYRSIRLSLRYRVDFFCFESVIVEVKALPGSDASSGNRRRTTFGWRGSIGACS